MSARAVPVDYREKSEYVDLIINKMLPAIKSENLADYIDVFCEKGYFNVEDTIKILEAGQKIGLKEKLMLINLTVLGV